MRNFFNIVVLIAGRFFLSMTCVTAYAQAQLDQGSRVPAQNSGIQTQADRIPSEPNSDAEQELEKGTTLTRTGHFVEAIPHLLVARGYVANEYAASMNLAICYIATNQPTRAIPILNHLRANGHENADVHNLLAQAYIGDGQNQQGLEALQKAASITPDNEKLYMFVADACTAKQAYETGMQVVELGLKHLPGSARLHFDRAMFLSLLDRYDEAKPDFALARKLAPDSDVAYLAGAQEAILDGNVPETIRITREAVKRGHDNFILLTLLGEALLRSGSTPGQPEFEEAEMALEKSVAQRPNYPSSQLTLGKLYLMDNRVSEAITRLETARQFNPADPAVYSNLAAAYRKQGDLQRAQDALATLAKINTLQAEKIRTAPGDRKASYATSGASDRQR